MVNVFGRLLCNSCIIKWKNFVSRVLLFLVVLGCCSRSDGVDDGVCRHVADVELEIKLVGEVLDGESAHLAAVERHCTELQLTSRRNVIPDIHHKHSLASSANDTHSTAGLNYS